MSTNSSIEWTEVTWNPVVGCTPVSPGCDLCYAGVLSHRLAAMGQEAYVGLTVKRKAPTRAGGRERATFNGTVRTLPDRLTDPLGWRKPRRVFVNSMSDLFHEAVPFEFIDRVFAVMALCTQHTFQVLTKRPERMAEYLTRWPNGMSRGHHIASQMNVTGTALRDPHNEQPGDGTGPLVRLPLPNVWLGTSVENQAAADERIPHLLKCPAAVRFLSCEPLLGPIEFAGNIIDYLREGTRCEGGVQWVIVGGESGPGARPCDVAWIRSIVAQCKVAAVPVFVKQMGTRPYHVEDGRELAIMLDNAKGGDIDEWAGYPSTDDLRVREMPQPMSPR